MRIEKFTIENYKSYRHTKEVDLSPGFNVLVGQNNSGKTALLECLDVNNLKNKPHTYSGLSRDWSYNKNSSISLTVRLTNDDMRNVFMKEGIDIIFPIRNSWERNKIGEIINNYLHNEQSIVFRVGGGPHISSPFPSHLLFTKDESNNFAHVRYNKINGQFFLGSIQGGENDNIGNYTANYYQSSYYIFNAERFSLGARAYGDNAALRSDAQNLSEVLNVLQGQHDRFELYNSLVHRVFPTVRRVSVKPQSGQNVIMVWNSEAPGDREDLAIPLSESGTGLGQVLAMLYVLVTSNTERTIIIDEPNTFLHPGAVRSLIDIMKRNKIRHQYVVSTHSPEIIRIAEPEKVYLIQWRNEQSQIEAIAPADVTVFRRALLEVGARLSDFYGADAIAWVEGATEEECFPKIIEAASVGGASGLMIVAVRATGDFEGRKASAVAIWEIYERMSTGGKLLPTTVAISLDREGRTEDDIAEARKRSNGLIRFLPRKFFESYLLHIDAIVALLNSLPSFQEEPVNDAKLRAWLHARGGAFEAEWSGDVRDPAWLADVHGARLLHALVQELSEAREEYRKVEHGAFLTQWICENDLTHFEELIGYLKALLGGEAVG